MIKNKLFVWKCAACEFIYKGEILPEKCPMCGKGGWYNLTNLGTKTSVGSEIKMIVKDKQGFVKNINKRRYKRAGASQNRAYEEFVIDRNDSSFTTKKQKVEEWNGKSWQIVHTEEKKSPAKRRQNMDKK